MPDSLENRENIHPETEQGPEPPKITRRAFVLGGVGAALAGLAAVYLPKFLVGEAEKSAAPVTGANPENTPAPGPTNTASPAIQETPTQTVAKPANPTATAAATPTEVKAAPAAPATPEAPKIAYWTKEQIIQAQREALNAKQILLLDTWSSSSKDIKTEETQNMVTGRSFIVINGFSQNQTLSSPLTGRVETVGVQTGGSGKGPKNRLLGIAVDNMIVSIYLNWDDKILVKQNELVTLNTPLAELSGRPLPSELGLTETGQIAITVRNIGASKETLLHDKNGALVHPQ